MPTLAAPPPFIPKKSVRYTAGGSTVSGPGFGGRGAVDAGPAWGKNPKDPSPLPQSNIPHLGKTQDTPDE